MFIVWKTLFSFGQFYFHVILILNLFYFLVHNFRCFIPTGIPSTPLEIKSLLGHQHAWPHIPSCSKDWPRFNQCSCSTFWVCLLSHYWILHLQSNFCDWKLHFAPHLSNSRLLDGGCIVCVLVHAESMCCVSSMSVLPDCFWLFLDLSLSLCQFDNTCSTQFLASCLMYKSILSAKSESTKYRFLAYYIPSIEPKSTVYFQVFSLVLLHINLPPSEPNGIQHKDKTCFLILQLW